MKPDFFLKTCFLVLCAILIGSCEKKGNPPEPEVGNPSDRELMLAHYADEIVIPAYANFKVKLDSLSNKSEDFTSNPTNTSLVELRNAWKEAYIEWQKVELFDFGPAFNVGLRSFFNIYPASVSGINDNILSGTANLEVPASYPQQGFPALDYLINGLGATDNDILAFYTSASDASPRIAYLQKLITQLNYKFNQVYSIWIGSYRNEFVSKTSMDMSSSTSLMVNAYVLNYERYIRSGKFGIPGGVMTGTAFPEKVESFYMKDLSLILAETAHQASIDFFNGKSVKTGVEGPSLKTYLNSLDAKDGPTGASLTQTINDQFALAEAKLDLLNDNLYQEIQTNNPAVVDVYNAMQGAVRMLKVDMTSAMSITITYTDNDGD